MAIQKILICDDSLTDQTNLKNALKDIMCLIFTASDGEEAITIAKAEIPD